MIRFPFVQRSRLSCAFTAIGLTLASGHASADARFILRDNGSAALRITDIDSATLTLSAVTDVPLQAPVDLAYELSGSDGTVESGSLSGVSGRIVTRTRNVDMTIRFNGFAPGDLVFSIINGNADVAIGSNVVGDFRLIVPQGTSNLHVGNTVFRKSASVLLGRNDDVVSIRDSFLGGIGLRALTRSGNDTLEFGPNVFMAGAAIRAGHGDDTLRMEETTVTKDFRTFLGRGADQVILRPENEFKDSAYFDLGSGNDSMGLCATFSPDRPPVLQGSAGVDDRLAYESDSFGDESNFFIGGATPTILDFESTVDILSFCDPPWPELFD